MDPSVIPEKCIIHIDMDAFYAQVEGKRHKIPNTVFFL